MKIRLLLFVAVALMCDVLLYAENACGAEALKYDTALRDSILSQISGARVSDRKVSFLDFGAKGDGKRDCRKAFDKAMKDARRHGGLHLVVPKGVYFMEGPLWLADNVCVELEEGAVLKFSSDPAKYPQVLTSWEEPIFTIILLLYMQGEFMTWRSQAEALLTGMRRKLSPPGAPGRNLRSSEAGI